ncbi:MAG: Lrp/AsnC family transcriptional regulator [Thaumarchaeota archaeon]|nr:Lrp/AsnC family transcriptional regulator [Nitrososphaerota archaeon]
MDAKDVRIFCEIAFRDLSYNASTQRHVSPTEIGRKLDLDEKTVRARIKKMEEDGFIKYYQAMPSLGLFGMDFITLHRFEALNIATKARLVESTQKIPNVVEVVDYIGPFVSIDIAGHTADEVKQAAEKIAMRFELTMLNLGMRPIRDPKVNLDKLDWQLVKGLRYDARMTTSELAKMLSITPRMAEYKVGKLFDSGALLIRAVINTQKQAGLVFYELEISVDAARRGDVIDALRKKHGEKLWSVNSPSPGAILVNLFGFTLADPEDSALAVLKVEGVKYCRLFMLKEVIEPTKSGWLDTLIESKVAA